jgi:hypothetical protein
MEITLKESIRARSREITFFVINITSLYYKVVVIKAPLQGLCYTERDAVDWLFSPTTQMVPERFQPQPFAVLLIS